MAPDYSSHRKFNTMKYWLGVVSKNHVLRGVQGGFAQVCHGKKGPLSKMKKDDWLIYYSPVEAMGSKLPLQAFTAIGIIEDDVVFQFKMAEDFCPFRRKVNYKKSKDVLLKTIKSELDFTQGTNWGFQLRRGLFETSKHDFDIISLAMFVNLDIKTLEKANRETCGT